MTASALLYRMSRGCQICDFYINDVSRRTGRFPVLKFYSDGRLGDHANSHITSAGRLAPKSIRIYNLWMATIGLGHVSRPTEMCSINR